MESLKDLQLRYESLKGLGLKLNIERGQPGDDNFDLSNAMLGIVTEGHQNSKRFRYPQLSRRSFGTAGST